MPFKLTPYILKTLIRAVNANLSGTTKFQCEWPILDRSKRPVGKWGVDIRVKYDVDITKAFAALRRDDSESRDDAAESKCGGDNAKNDSEMETGEDVE